VHRHSSDLAHATREVHDGVSGQRRSSVSAAPIKLYVCWGTFATPRPGGHPCSNAHEALRGAGHDPEVVKSYGLANPAAARP
jgi:hypothetical protein